MKGILTLILTVCVVLNLQAGGFDPYKVDPKFEKEIGPLLVTIDSVGAVAYAAVLLSDWRNLWTVCQPHLDLSDAADELQIELRLLDLSVNVNWPLMHYKSAVRYLQQSPADIAATGGTNWQKYLPPRFQLRVFYPTLWDQNEINHWGKSRE